MLVFTISVIRAAPTAVHNSSGLVLGDCDTNVPLCYTRLFENYDRDRGNNTIWLSVGDSDDAPKAHLHHFTWQTGEQGRGQRLVYATWDNKGKGCLLAATVLHKDLPAHSRVVLTLGSLNFNQRLQLETIMQDTPVPRATEGLRTALRKEWCIQILEKGIAQKLFTGVELQAAVQALDTEKIL
ncbi:uncharacterized protein PHACADRAFT_133501 [Phanerochaete carnosa HHB-10118-sp]|uniref:Uncharacterized protein n=1 Tax=Phanerochaete carnosa (strain HHB-10118-sp) TaxID=650164 RepID=K5WNG5_PHACS|nr:uncharacterized protein PHACADRAFT_133501 [Phanerochaete carnosa HHB-10118-sp]EKM60754.1 hypothetical protein PHACADRAFT_133501 [Phanerochaete carnosa HHB-10118-sp]